MDKIIQSIDYISTYRADKIKELVKIVALPSSRVEVNMIAANRSVVLGVSNTIERGVDFTEWRFKTRIDSVFGMYYEIWRPAQKNNYSLDRLYFHLYKENYEDYILEEYILLHCDVDEPDASPHAKYKQSPHLHFHFAPAPLPKAHIALNNGNLVDILSSVDGVHLAMQQAVEMIDDQILKAFLP